MLAERIKWTYIIVVESVSVLEKSFGGDVRIMQIKNLRWLLTQINLYHNNDLIKKLIIMIIIIIIVIIIIIIIIRLIITIIIRPGNTELTSSGG